MADSAADVLLTYRHLRGPAFDHALALVRLFPPEEQVAVAVRIGKATRSPDPADSTRHDDSTRPSDAPPRPLWARAIAYPIAATIIISSALVALLVLAWLARAVVAAWRTVGG